MLFEAQGDYNNLSDKFRKELEEKVRQFGKTVRYKFHIGRPDPVPENKAQGKIVYPGLWTLDPVSFRIKDPYETNGRPMKLIGLVRQLSSEEQRRQNVSDRLERIRLTDEDAGELVLHLDIHEDFEKACVLELHPCQIGGEFSDPTKPNWFERIDENKIAKEKINSRSERKKAFETVGQMNGKELQQFADAMEWPYESDAEILLNKVEEFADNNATTFNKLMEGKTVEYRAMVKKAKDKGVLSFNPADNTYLWANGQVAATLQISDKTDVQAMATYLETGGESAKKTLEKIKSLLK